MFMRLLSFFLAAGLLFAGPARAAGAPTPDAALRGTTERIQTLIRDNHKAYRADLPTFYKAIDEIVVPRFDVPYITQIVLARHYRTASAEQRQRFAEAFKNMLVKAYANAMLDNYDSVKIEWLPVRLAENAKTALVNTALTTSAGKRYLIGFRVRQVENDWRVFDISVENISLATNFRTQLGAEITRTSLDDVIRRMESGEFTQAAPTVQ